MERELPRSELVKALEAKSEQLHRYETRLRDVVHAYKGVLKEKEALEATVKVLSSATRESSDGEKVNLSSSDDKTAVGDEDISHPLADEREPTEKPSGDEAVSERDKVSTLSSSIATLTQEKSRLEAGYLAEKKKLRQDNEDLQKQLEELKEKSAQTEQARDEEIQQLKSKIRNQQHERETEQTDHAVMLRELQKLLATERSNNEQLEHQLDEARERLRVSENQPNVAEQYERRIRELSNELQSVRTRLQAAEVKADEPSPFMLELQREMADMKTQYRLQVVQEQRRANEAEEKLRSCDQQGEERVSGLEDKLSELSGVVGNYERLRYQDQAAIQRLKERVTQLDMENSALVQAVHPTSHSDDNDDNLDAQALAAKILRLTKLLKLANDRSEKPVDMEEVLGSSISECAECAQYQEEVKKVREEFERYKLRAQSVLLKNKSRDPVSTKTEDMLRGEVGQLKDKVKTLRLQCDDSEVRQKAKEEELTRTIVSLQQQHRREVEQAVSDHKHELSELEQQLRKQRERTVSLLAEKDREIEQLRGVVGSVRRSGEYSASMVTPKQLGEEQDSQHAPLSRTHSEEEEAVSRLLQHPGLLQGETNLIYVAQEHARKDVEINGLRRNKRALENALRELQHSSSMKEEKYQDEIEHLKEEIRQHQRHKSREGANLEYLKNVTFRFLTSSNFHAKQQMFNAISTILQFSPKEKTKVDQYMKSWWGT